MSATSPDRARLDALFAVIGDAIRGEAPCESMPAVEAPGRLDALAAAFGLDAAAAQIVVLAAAQELAPATLDGRRATVALAEAFGGEAVWDALCPQAALRRWRIVELEGGGPMAERAIRLDERILHFLLGADYIDARLDGLVDCPPHRAGPAGAGAALASRFARLWEADAETGWPVLQLCGCGLEARRAVAGEIARLRHQRLFRIWRRDIPKPAFERLALARLCDREMALSHGALLIEGDSDGEGETAAFAELLTGPTILSSRESIAISRRRLRGDLPAPPPAERRALWTEALGARQSAEAGPALDALAVQFSLDGEGIRAVAELADDPLRTAEAPLADRLWDAARVQARRALDDLAERIDSNVGWEDLVLPPDRLDQLRDVAVHVRRAHQVHDDWGWSTRGTRGLGVTALFAGPSGTGKTMAAELLANELRLDLYRIDLSQVVSKYIGETEKNLRRIFEAAEASGAILLFDEADALFGKRSEVKDSHDRYANIEVSYLLQRMEAYRGLAILTTNLRNALDPAFMRRLRFAIEFPFPDASMRSEIWRRIFPRATPLNGVDVDRLARLAVAGGAIRTIAINAAFLAAEAGGPVSHDHILTAARREYAKLEKPVTTAEFGAGR
jgi:ATPase family associated with various cellular activities (AAA)